MDMKPSADRGETGLVFPRVWAAGFLVLVAVSWPLWWRVGGDGTLLPRVRWIPLPDAPAAIASLEAALLGVVLVASAVAVWMPQRRIAWLGIAVCLAFLILLDQHRLQPWAYQTWLYSLLFFTRPWHSARRSLMAIAISVYLFSAAGKFDFQFAHTVGRDLFQALAQPLGGVGDARASRLALLLPAGELVTALLLILPPTRRAGGVLAIAMHVTLFLLLGPWALNHSLGVLTWNALLATQAWLLFVRKPNAERREPANGDAPSENDRGTLLRWPVNGVVLVALLAPLAERRGYWDHWTSWALYSPHNSRVDLEVHRSAVERLPEAYRDYLRGDGDVDAWRELDVERLSLDTRRVPLYPQARYQTQLALSIADEYQLDRAVRAIVKGTSDRWTGTRDEQFAIGRDALQETDKHYWLGR